MARKYKTLPIEATRLERFAGGGQTLGTLPSGKRVFAWGGLPGEAVQVQLTKSKSSLAEGIVTAVDEASPQRIDPKEPDSYLSTSPWQIMTFDLEQAAKAQLIREAFELHKLALPDAEATAMYSDGQQFAYRNKVEFSWYWDTVASRLELAFFKRGGRGKIPVEGTALARPEINRLALAIRDCLRGKGLEARSYKTLLIRCDQNGNCCWQLYVKDHLPDIISDDEAAAFGAQGGEVIYSDPRSPASRITERLRAFGDPTLSDSLLEVPFRYATEGFFQVNLPVYTRSLQDMQSWVLPGPVVDMYSGVGSIGLTVGGDDVSLVEIDQHAFREMQANIALSQKQGRLAGAQPVLAAAEQALQYIDDKATIVVDPPRAGLHQAVVERLLAVLPPRVIYLSCNPVTQARDTALLSQAYKIVHHQGYNFFPRTPHIEHLLVLDRR